MRYLQTRDGRFPTLRLFVVASLIGVALTAIFLFALYRQTAISAIVAFGEASNEDLAYMALNPVRPLLIDYLNDVNILDGKHPRSPAMEEVIWRLMDNTQVRRVKIYDDHGHVAYSTELQRIGQLQADNPGFISAMQGIVLSKLVYRDTLNLFDAHHEDANLIQTYLPIRESPRHPVIGVFEIYRDVNPLVARTERTELVIVAGVSTILLALFSFLFFVVRYSDRTIQKQQRTISERTQTLEVLSAEMLNAQELEKRAMAGELHEGIAQTLGGIKVHLEALVGHDGHNSANGVQRLIPIVQDAIQEVRDLAMQLRPPSLDDLGLVATLSWLTKNFTEIYGIEVSANTQIEEAAIPDSLKIIIYRVAQDALRFIGRTRAASHVQLTLKIDTDGLVISLADDGAGYVAERTTDMGMGLVRERTVLSGGHFDFAQVSTGCEIVASWPLAGQLN